MIYKPLRGKYYGSQIAAPVFKEIADRIYANLDEISNPPVPDTLGFRIPYASSGLQKDIAEVYTHLDIPFKPVNPASQWAKPFYDSISVTLMPEIISQVSMPDVTGMGVKDAVFLLEELGLRVKVNGKGAVSRQSLQPGQAISKGAVVILDLSTIKT